MIHPTGLVRRKERRGRGRSHTVDRETGGRRKRVRGNESGSLEERNPFRNCKPPCSIPLLRRFLLSYPDTLPWPFPGSFPQEKPLPLPVSLSFASSLSLPHSIWLSPFREAACSPRILISSKVLFPLNRAATRNNALYVRVLRLSFLPPSSSLAFSSSLASVLRFVAALTSPSRFLRPFVTPANSQYTQISSDVVSPMNFYSSCIQ